jgi:hypothetical protein
MYNIGVGLDASLLLCLNNGFADLVLTKCTIKILNSVCMPCLGPVLYTEQILHA